VGLSLDTLTTLGKTWDGMAWDGVEWVRRCFISFFDLNFAFGVTHREETDKGSSSRSVQRLAFALNHLGVRSFDLFHSSSLIFASVQ